LTSNSANSIKL